MAKPRGVIPPKREAAYGLIASDPHRVGRPFPRAPSDKRYGGEPKDRLSAAHEWQMKAWMWMSQPPQGNARYAACLYNLE